MLELDDVVTLAVEEEGQLLDDDGVVLPLLNEDKMKLDGLALPVDDGVLPPPCPPDCRSLLLVVLIPAEPPNPPPPQFSWSGCCGQARFAGTKPPIPSQPPSTPTVASAMRRLFTIPP